jgi:DNA-binding transcriptional regulator GbsR (MarR family)
LTDPASRTPAHAARPTSRQSRKATSTATSTPTSRKAGGAAESLASDPVAERFIERLGLFSELEGLPRIAGRIFGLLLLSPRECSLDEIAERLRVSKASASTDVRRIAELGYVERVSRPGDRRDYYRVAEGMHERHVEQRLARLREFRRVTAELRQLPKATPVVRQRLDRFAAVADLMVDAFESILAHGCKAPAAQAPHADAHPPTT